MEQRREGEGSSDKNSPPTSVVLLGQADTNLQVINCKKKKKIRGGVMYIEYVDIMRGENLWSI